MLHSHACTCMHLISIPMHHPSHMHRTSCHSHCMLISSNYIIMSSSCNTPCFITCITCIACIMRISFHSTHVTHHMYHIHVNHAIACHTHKHHLSRHTRTARKYARLRIKPRTGTHTRLQLFHDSPHNRSHTPGNLAVAQNAATPTSRCSSLPLSPMSRKEVTTPSRASTSAAHAEQAQHSSSPPSSTVNGRSRPSSTS